MYKDKDKQRKANKEAAKRYRDNKKGMTEGVTTDDSIITPVTLSVIPKDKKIVIPWHNNRLEPMKQLRREPVKPQSHSPMMVGYVPPKEDS